MLSKTSPSNPEETVGGATPVVQASPEGSKKGDGKWFSKAMFWQTLNTFCPIPIAYFCILFLALPMDIFMWEVNGDTYEIYNNLREYANYGMTRGLPSAFFVSVLSAMMVFRYLCNNRSVNMVHSLPIRREALYVTQYLTGLSFVIVPNLLLLLCTILALMTRGIYYFEPFVIMCAVNSGLYFFFYSFAVLCAMFTGSVGAIFLYYLTFNFVVAFVSLLMQPLFEIFYLGYYGSTFSYPFVQLLTPLYALVVGASVQYSHINLLPDVFERGGFFDMLPENIVYTMAEGAIFGWYLVAGIVFSVVGFWLYKHRHIENAGEAVSVVQLKPVFRFAVALLGGIAMGLVTVTFITDDYLDSAMAWMIPMASLFWGVVFCLLAEMILQKTFRVWKQWKHCVLPVVALCGVFLVIAFDLTGFEDKVPTFSDVESVTVFVPKTYPDDSAGGHIYLNRSQYDPEVEAALFTQIVDLHKASLQNARLYDPYKPQQYDDEGDVYFYYHQESEYVTQRHYVVGYDFDDMNVAGSFSQALTDVMNNRDVLREEYRLELIDGSVATVGLLHLFDEEKDDFVSNLYLVDFLSDVTVKELEEVHQQLLEAVTLDFDQGNLGQKYLSKSDPLYVREGVPLRVEMEYSYTYGVLEDGTTEKIVESTSTTNKNLSATPSQELQEGLSEGLSAEHYDKESLGSDGYQVGGQASGTVYIQLTQNATHTLALLEELGVLEQYSILTNQEHLEKMRDWNLSTDESDWTKLTRMGLVLSEDSDVTDPMSYVTGLR